MKKLIIALQLFLTAIVAYGNSFPTISTGENTVWYLIQFKNGENVLASKGDNAKATTVTPTGKDNQLWKVEGNSTSGYMLTNKLGLRLYLENTNTGGLFYTSSNPTNNYHFGIPTTTNTTYGGSFEIQPHGVTSLSMNQWGGAGTGVDLGLYNKGDKNNPLHFLSYDEYLATGKQLPIIPYPQSLIKSEGKLSINTLTSITYTNDEVKKAVERFANQLKTSSAINLTTTQSSGLRADNTIHLKEDSSLPKEGYTLTIDDKGIEISASEFGGFFYALQTLQQLMPYQYFGKTLNSTVEWTLPHVEIADQPRLGHRGYMLDIARHFYDKEEVKRILDALAMYKINRFHWHLTDDQGWRVEIPEYPKLTTVGAIRSGSFISKGMSTKFFDDTEYGRGMYYTLDDLREVVAYAKERNIEIIPEVDLPGHMVAAITAYPELSCDPTKKYSVRLDEGVSHDVLNIGKDEVIDFLKCVLGHISTVFPYKYVHIGGDECPTTVWKTNPDCLRRVKEEGLTGVEQLQTWLVEYLGQYLKTEYNKDIIVWDELLDHWNANKELKPVIMAWRGFDKSSHAANLGLKSIIVPYGSLYFDMLQGSVNQLDVNEIYHGGYGDSFVVSVQSIYGVNPTQALEGREEFCLGVQANQWTETCITKEMVEYQLLPRILSVAEIGWLDQAKKSWISYYSRLQSHDEILDIMGYTYAKHYIEAPDKTPVETAIDEAKEILDASIRGAVGYPSAEMYDALNNAIETLKENPTLPSAQTALNIAVQAYKAAPITQPEPDKVYKVVSASTHYKKRYVGSTIYDNNGTLKLHYHEQIEPEDLWKFVATENGYIMTSYYTGKKVYMPAYNATVSLENDMQTEVRLDLATVATGKYSYVPGVMNISAVEGYTASTTGNVKRIFANPSSVVAAFNDPTLCNPGTWKLIEVTDFREQLQGLVTKCERIIEKSKPGEMGEPSQEAIDMLQQTLINPAKAELETEMIDQNKYDQYVSIYNNFLATAKTSYLDYISETNFYHLQNGYHQTEYAKANTVNNTVVPAALVTSDDAFRWRFAKNNDATAYIINKATGTKVHFNNATGTESLKLGAATSATSSFSLLEITTDLGQTGISIIEKSGVFGWYVNKGSFSTVVLQPYDWGASIWNLIKLEDVYNAIEETDTDKEDLSKLQMYDLLGRSVDKTKMESGIYIRGNKKIVIQ